MRIAVDMHFLQGKAQGISTVLRGLYSALAEKRSDYEFLFLFNYSDKVSDKWSQFGKVVNLGNASRFKRLSYTIGKVIDANGGADITHVNAVVPFNLSSPVVLTLHDLLFISHPNYFGFGFRHAQRLAVRYSIQRANAIATVSNYTREELTKKYPNVDDKTICIPNGVDITSNKVHEDSDQIGIIQDRNLLISGYILTVSRIDKRKNHSTMLEAYADLVARRGPNKVPQMVVVGSVDNKYFEGEKLLKEFELKEGIIWLQDVNEVELKRLYKYAGLFVMASHAEGFGLPLLEAMAMEVPVIGGNNTAMRELVADAGILVNTNDSMELSQAYEELLFNENLRAKCKVAGKIKARKYTWENAAYRYQELFDAVASDD